MSNDETSETNNTNNNKKRKRREESSFWYFLDGIFDFAVTLFLYIGRIIKSIFNLITNN